MEYDTNIFYFKYFSYNRINSRPTDVLSIYSRETFILSEVKRFGQLFNNIHNFQHNINHRVLCWLSLFWIVLLIIPIARNIG